MRNRKGHVRSLVKMYRVALNKHSEVIQEINELRIKLAEQSESVKGGTSAKQGLEYMFTRVHQKKLDLALKLAT